MNVKNVHMLDVVCVKTCFFTKVIIVFLSRETVFTKQRCRRLAITRDAAKVPRNASYVVCSLRLSCSTLLSRPTGRWVICLL